MAYSPSEKYPGAVDSDPNYQGGKFRDNNPSTTNNGSPLKAIDRNELLARDEAIMNDAGFEYNGLPDTPQDSQMFRAYKASLGNGANLLSNHNFLIQTPDDSQPLPSSTPTSYPPGYQIFSGVFANETSGITNLTYIDGRVSFSGGDLYFAVPNTGAIARLDSSQLVASVADFDGKPRTRGVSFGLVGDEYRVTVGIDALEDSGGNETLLGSVKFEQGSVATGHEVVVNSEELVNTGDSLITSGVVFPRNNQYPLVMGSQSTTVNTNASRFIVDNGMSVELLYLWEPSGVLPPPPFIIDDIQVGDSSDYTLLVDGVEYKLINGKTKELRNSSRPEGWGVDADAIEEMVKYTSVINFKEQFDITRPATITTSGIVVNFDGGSLRYTGEGTSGNSNRLSGGLTFNGTVDSSPITTVTSDIEFGSNIIEVSDTSGISKGDYLVFNAELAGDSTTVLRYRIQLLIKVNAVNGTSIETDYRAGFNYTASDVTLTKSNPIKNIIINNFLMDDQQYNATPDNGLQAPLDQRNAAVCGVALNYAVDCEVNSAKTENAKWPVVKLTYTNTVKSKGVKCKNPLWTGPGAGYGIQSLYSINCTGEAEGFNSRHAIDWTSCAYCSGSGTDEASDNSVSFHGGSEHNITVYNSRGNMICAGVGNLPNFGGVTHSIMLDNCNFTRLIGNCLDMTIANYTKIDTMEINTRTLTVTANSTVYNGNIVTLDGRINSGIYNAAPRFEIGEDCRWVMRGSPKVIDGFHEVIIYGTLVGDRAAGVVKFNLLNNRDIRINGKVKNVEVEFQQSQQTIDARGLKSEFTQPQSGATLRTRNLSAFDDTVTVNITGMDLNGFDGSPAGSRGYNFNVSGESSPVKLAIISGLNSFRNQTTGSIIAQGLPNYIIDQSVKVDEVYVNSPQSTRI